MVGPRRHFYLQPGPSLTLGLGRRLHRSTLAAAFGLFLALAATALPLSAQTTLYWDTNGSSSAAGGASPSGTWKNSGSGNDNWTTNANGTSSTQVWLANAIAVFSAGTTATGTYTVTVSSTQSVDSIRIDEGTVTFNSGTLTLTGDVPSISVASGRTATFATKLAGSNGLVKTGAGTLYLTNASNSYTGDTVVSAGTLRVSSTSTVLPSGTALSVASGATFAVDAGGSTQQVGSISGAGTLNLSDTLFKVGDTTSTTFSGKITDTSGGSTLQKIGTGALTLSGASTFGGAIDVNAGTIIAASSGALGTASSGNDIGSGAALQLTGGITLTETDLAIRGAGDGTGVLRNLSGNNTLNAAVTLASTATIASDAGTLNLAGGVDLGSRTLTTTGAGALQFDGAMTGSGGKLIVDGSGTVTLSGSTANTFTGSTAVNDGTLQLNKTAGVNALDSTSVTVGDGSGAAGSASLSLLASDQLAANTTLTINSDGRFQLNNHSESVDKLQGAGAIDLGTMGTLTVGTGNSNFSFGGAITGSGTLAKTGTGYMSFNSSISFTGTLSLLDGTLRLNGNDLTVSTLHITGHTTIDFGSGSASMLNVGNFIIDAGAVLTIINWTNTVDYFYAQSWTGATYDNRGSAPANQVTFNGDNGNNTAWQSFDNQVTPVPEPATYGALLTATAAALAFWRRRRSL